MRPIKVHENDRATKGAATVMNNGSRPSPLKINKDSHSIHKPFDSGSILAVENQTKRQPVIIYTHSPKIIHAKARDFMSLVQKLTGSSTSDDSQIVNPKRKHVKSMEQDSFSDEKDNKMSSILTADKFDHGSAEGSTMYKWGDHNTYLQSGDIPVSTLNSNESFLCSSRDDSLFRSPSFGGSVSPSMFMDSRNVESGLELARDRMRRDIS